MDQLCFGSVVSYKSVLYVYLASIRENTYLAKIIDEDLMRAIIQREKAVFLTSKKTNQDNPLFCVVCLKTDEFVGRGAYYDINEHNPAHSTEIFSKDFTLISQLNDDDRVLLCESMKLDRFVPRDLKDFATSLTF